MGGVHLDNVKPLKCWANATESIEESTKCALVKTRWTGNKTFILQDFFTSPALDIMLITETWTCEGESVAFTELLPLDCSFLHVPRTSGGGVEYLDIKQVSRMGYSSFELWLFEFGPSGLCAVVCWPPQYNCGFITDFLDFLANVTLKYDQLLIVGDFNVHVCCPCKPLAKDFLDVIDSLNLNMSLCPLWSTSTRSIWFCPVLLL